MLTYNVIGPSLGQDLKDRAVTTPGGGEQKRRGAIWRRVIDVNPGADAKPDTGDISGAGGHVERVHAEPAAVWRYWRRWGCHWWIQIRRRNSIRSGSRYFQDVGAVTRQVTKQPLKEEKRNPIVCFSFYWIITNFVWPIYGSTAEHIILFVPAKTMIK